jgi:branched-subunit amino acid aminotransferase/4-amino-4-deoxychorismate lyase
MAHAPTPQTSPVSAADLASLDGRIAPAPETSISVMDDGFLRGDGVFEVVRVYAGTPFALAEHLDRMERSAANLRLGYDVPRAELEIEAAELLRERGGPDFDGCLRLVLTRGGRRLLITEPLPGGRGSSIRLGFVTYAPSRILDGIKSLSYAGNMLATRLARERGFDEALLVTPHGRVLEAPTSSFFWVPPSGELCTPPLDEHILASITRDRLLKLLDVEQRVATTEEVLEAREAFIASTTREVQPVSAIEDREFGEPGERTRDAAARFSSQLEQEIGES